MTPLALLLGLANRGIRLSANGDKLRVDAPSWVLTDELRAALVEHRDALLRVPPTACPRCGNGNPARWRFSARGQKCWQCGWTRLYLEETKA